MLDDAFEGVGGAGVVPDTFGIDDGDGALDTDAEALDAGAIDEGLEADEVEFFEAAFEEFPGFKALGAGGAAGGGFIDAEEDVASVLGEAAGLGGGEEFGGGGHSRMIRWRAVQEAQ